MYKRQVDSPPYAIKDRIVSYLSNTYRILLGLLLKQQVYAPSRIGIDFIDENTPLDVYKRQPLIWTPLQSTMATRFFRSWWLAAMAASQTMPS